MPPRRVWDVLTRPEFTQQWVRLFQPVFAELKSDWKLNSLVEWETSEGTVLVDGKVTKYAPYQYLSYTVHDTSGGFDDVQSDEDGIVYELNERDGHTLLIVRQGDFKKVGERAQEFRDATAESWARALPMIKELAEEDK